MLRNTRRRARNILCFLSGAACLLAAPASASAADSCANAAFRPGTGANLPDCRAWEQVSPTDKSGNDVVTTSTVASLASGSKVYFNASGSINNSQTVLYDTAYLSGRGSDWATRGLDPPATASGLLVKLTLGVSEDGTKAVVVTPRALAPGAIEGGSNLYLHDLTQNSYRVIVAQPTKKLYDDLTGFGGQGGYVGGTADLSTIAFLSREPLTPDAAPEDPVFQYRGLYLWRNGQIELAGKTPDGTPLEFQQSPNTPSRARPQLSDDGTRVTFVPVQGTGSIPATYQYVTGQGTTLISRSYRAGGDADEPIVARDPFPSRDGRAITFIADEALTDDPTATPGATYQWSAATPVPEVVAPDADTPLAVSPDGRYVWFRETIVQPGGAVPRISVRDTQANTTEVVAVLRPEEPGISSDAVRLSPDGSRIVFQSFSPVTGVDNANAACREPGKGQDGFCGNLFTFDAKTPSAGATCISCLPASQARGAASFSRSSTSFDGRESRPIMDDGRVYFETPNQLVSADTNVVNDVYEFKPGAGVRLISSGTSGSPAAFGDTSEDGRDVFFVTADKLVPQDVDELADLYTARVGGGIASQQVAPAAPGSGCSGEACRPGSAVTPPRPAPGSSAFTPLNVVEPRFSFSRPSARTLRSAGRSGRLTVPVRVNLAGRVTATLTGRLSGRKTSRAGGAAVRTTKAGTVRITVRLSRQARAALKRKGSLRLRLTVRYSRSDRTSSTVLTFTTGRAATSNQGGAR